MSQVDHIAGHTWHGRKGEVRNAFRYSIDYVMLDAEAPLEDSFVFARNRAALFSIRERDHGGQPGQGRGAAWVREVVAAHGLESPARIMLLAQPRVLGHVFNPVSFWLCFDKKETLRAAIAEVTNTYGDRHCYLCTREDHAAITPEDRIEATKIFYVSPFQRIGGTYSFRFDIRADRVGIWIDLTDGNFGVTATLTGKRRALGLVGVLRALMRRPFGSRRVLALIHWQALKLWWKGARFRARPEPPAHEVSR
ncbi:DUF1365 domain-containing protein [Roseovarius aestuariivivens]|uniref:DUF1365 domain-containing protein n=1 Tax=Roseovarius aestuariivivens TaxID=1888910 RepID=UPI00108078DA|nr:DUF1365 domain-containing protein [Roseovarius aestuariivivens]